MPQFGLLFRANPTFLLTDSSLKKAFADMDVK